jgi:pyruvate formate lyase activating enzyme
MCGAALVGNIQRFSLDDGPGIRTTVFLKGCNLRCAWCHNPESLGFSPVLQFFPAICRGCGKCVDACPQGAHRLLDGGHVFDRDLCEACGTCASACRTGALKLVGDKTAPEALVRELLKDRHYFASSGGGVTFSGGEPALKPDYIIEVAKLCRAENIPVALDTAGNVPFESYAALLPHIDLFLYDVKCFDPALHMRWTLVDNRLILENLRALDKAGAAYIVRVPVIPRFNADLGEQERIARFLATLQNPGLIQLPPYHAYGVGKYEALGFDYALDGLAPPSAAFMEEALLCYRRLGLPAEIA